MILDVFRYHELAKKIAVNLTLGPNLTEFNVLDHNPQAFSSLTCYDFAFWPIQNKLHQPKYCSKVKWHIFRAFEIVRDKKQDFDNFNIINQLTVIFGKSFDHNSQKLEIMNQKLIFF